MSATRTAGSAPRAGLSTGALPNLIVIGAMKCGTSALHYYLDLHPEVQMSSPKELNFYCGEAERPPSLAGASEVEQRMMSGGTNRWELGVDWYVRHFDQRARVRGEASPNYTAPWYPRVAERIESVAPDARLILMVRDPLDQLVSQYLHYRHAGNEPRSLEEALADPDGLYFERARYHGRLEPFLDVFARERILVLAQEDLLSRRRETLARVFGFLDVDESFWTPRMERIRHSSSGKGLRARAVRRVQHSRLGRVARVLPQEAKWYVERLSTGGPGSKSGQGPLRGAPRDRAADAVREDVEQLRRLTGSEFAEWSL